uniref:DUF4283 domain-containing protein n=1 Tax=Cannabis sativa TaxID=3483 RepID=A0A803PSI9_CANSA
MVKKRKGTSKPCAANVNVARASLELPSIQDEATEVFLDPCDELEPEKEVVAEAVKSTPKSKTWADDAEAMDFQASAQFTWSKFNLNQVKTPSSQLTFTEPSKIGDQRIWGNLGVERIVRMHSGFTLVSFKDGVTRNIILKTGVIQFDKKPVILRPWSEDMDTARMVKSILVWVRLNGLGLQYWGKKNLSALVSTIGKSIMADKVTLERSMIKYARVLVDVEIKEEPLRTIAYVNEKKQLMEQPVEYEWLPTKCTACDMLGHSISNCNKGKPTVWKKKQQGNKITDVEQDARSKGIPTEKVNGAKESEKGDTEL